MSVRADFSKKTREIGEKKVVIINDISAAINKKLRPVETVLLQKALPPSHPGHGFIPSGHSDFHVAEGETAEREGDSAYASLCQPLQGRSRCFTPLCFEISKVQPKAMSFVAHR